VSLDDGQYQARQQAFLRDAITPILALLEDPTVTEIMLNADGCVWVDQAGKSLRTEVTMDAHRALAILRAVAGQADLQLTASSPSLDAELRPWGARVKAAIPPITKAPVFTIRKPPARVFTLDEYVGAGIVTAAQADVLRAAIIARQNILVSGATASGKTTFVNALLAEIARTEDRVFIVEDIPELQCGSPNRVQYHVQPPFTTRLAIMDALRSRPDRIVVGEVREGGAALELIKAWNTGHPGGTGTLHANDNRQALNRLCQLIEEVAQRAPREIIAETVNVCAHIRRDPRLQGQRRLAGLHFVRGLAKDGAWDLLPLTDARQLAALVAEKAAADPEGGGKWREDLERRRITP
jgi:type IV secretion system protein VirB11